MCVRERERERTRHLGPHLFNITHKLAYKLERVPKSRLTRITYSKFTCLSLSLSLPLPPSLHPLPPNFFIPSGTCSYYPAALTTERVGGVSRNVGVRAQRRPARARPPKRAGHWSNGFLAAAVKRNGSRSSLSHLPSLTHSKKRRTRKREENNL